MISNVYDILGDNIFVRTANAGMVNQHVGFRCDKPWLISVKLSLVVNLDVGIMEKQHPEDKKCDNKPDLNIQVKDQNVDNVVSGKDVIGDKDKKIDNPKDNLKSNDNSVTKTKDGQGGVIKCEVISSEVTTSEPTIINVNEDNLKTTGVKPCENKPKEVGVNDKKEENKVVKPIENVPDVRYQIINFPIRKQLELISYSKLEVNKELPELSKADIVIAGGKSFNTEKNFTTWLKPLALRLGAAIGATKSAVELGCAPIRLQIGSTGSTITPRLYIAFGISGSKHHMVGVKDAKTIVAVNTDKDAAIMSMADYSLTMDMFDVISGMMKWLDNNKDMDIYNLIQNLNRNQSKPVQSEPDQTKSDKQEVKMSTN
ncbi:Electron transfer flavoprotein large subunit [Candidatus Hodgkinia cicadicola]|uniref:Electron transfer flavoprotein large subunit n=1 Tax=Candidatus Hodgkinia cicadicola TaxID=573658 RepID=A0ABX4MFX7_9HYPH|nr:Electron transfer flavoprotein large subunit [Candidatus Hodgkinia cicadicola]PIM96857.1 Electron transfer flavoprotein large subunit [Candidatus Hodgkinia cicadicola]